jgi:hypothetical protein
MPCEDISVSLQVDPPSGDSEVNLELNKICNADETAEWKLHFQLKLKNASGVLSPVITFDVDINHEDHPAAEATANNGMDPAQRAQADVASQTALLQTQGAATEDDVKQQAAAIVPARDPASPS